MTIEMAGYIRKTHAGGAYTEARSVKRWLLSDGFQVRYSKSPSGTQTGKFDLRNVEELRMVSRGDAPGVRVKVRDRGNKLLEIHFLTSGPRWIEYWASAVAESALDDELRQWRRAEMTAQLDSTYADQAGLKAKGAGTTDDLLFSPRERAGAAEASQPPPRAVAPLNHSTAESTASTAEGVPAAADGDDDDDVFIVTVPPLSKPGDKLRATDQYGSRMILVVPPGASPGTTLEYVKPKATSAGAATPASAPAASYAAGAPSPSSGGGAAASGGPSYRNSSAPLLGDDDEEGPAGWLGSVLAKCLPRCLPADGGRARKYEDAMARGEYQTAAGLASSEEESRRVGQAKDQTAAFVAAIRSYDWEAAKRLARSQQEKEDLEDSIVRVNYLNFYIDRHETGAALELAITEAEVARIHAAAAAS
ncbi:hypothetical protein EMIHUDRAFT_435832 [Emiliania huxleyi CCMP1516]|uniref:PH domain-containing protein n=2 Tax=Emiliania huxleyi TaxID=2903 RepID=A0A0D3JAA4_EMIH1|nr:hypothetical protein EMIHUDRAFT_435832 [Emiliania huxleyi CCMP1516]EOD20439.1 hypothetical protein EMIHUDRAFT_435832 [Emiliania huxleyi CCMP1516]|eukprot:XP_005772868.1 hypothetical protein EMIHUDRAFT_435832 [Emiliania huxleyi CCMP1516]